MWVICNVIFANTINFHMDMGYAINSSPINVGKLIHENILDNTESVVFTSATLANSTGTVGMPAIEWMTGYSYLESDRRFKTGLFLENNYDYKNNAKVFLAGPPLVKMATNEIHIQVKRTKF